MVQSCVVCLERLDSNITGLITIPCHHTFHCSCLSKWASGKCPVCRYTQNLAKVKSNRIHDDEFARTTCDQCGSSEKLWMCLICGHAGGGRYACRHAVSHFEQSGHLYAMELETQRVWDYVSFFFNCSRWNNSVNADKHFLGRRCVCASADPESK